MKKFMFYLMVINNFLASIVMIIVLAMGNSDLPLLTFGLRGALIAAGVVLVVRRYASWVRRGELTAWYLAEAAVAVFNLVYLSVFSHVNVQTLEFVITGTLVTPVLNGALILLLFKAASRYAVIGELEEEEAVSAAGSAAQSVQPAAKW